jgi:transposase-like protein
MSDGSRDDKPSLNDLFVKCPRCNGKNLTEPERKAGRMRIICLDCNVAFNPIRTGPSRVQLIGKAERALVKAASQFQKAIDAMRKAFP